MTRLCRAITFQPWAATEIPFNQGIFTTAEVALLAKLHPTTVKRWFFSNHMGKAMMPPSGADGKTLSFWDLVQAMAVRAIRRDQKVPLPKIREAVQRAEAEYGLKHIFARPHQTVLFMGDIFIYPEGQPSPVQLTGKRPNQLAIRHLVEPYQRDLAFDESMRSSLSGGRSRGGGCSIQLRGFAWILRARHGSRA